MSLNIILSELKRADDGIHCSLKINSLIDNNYTVIIYAKNLNHIYVKDIEGKFKYKAKISEGSLAAGETAELDILLDLSTLYDSFVNRFVYFIIKVIDGSGRYLKSKRRVMVKKTDFKILNN